MAVGIVSTMIIFNNLPKKKDRSRKSWDSFEYDILNNFPTYSMRSYNERYENVLLICQKSKII